MAKQKMLSVSVPRTFTATVALGIMPIFIGLFGQSTEFPPRNFATKPWGAVNKKSGPLWSAFCCLFAFFAIRSALNPPAHPAEKIRLLLPARSAGNQSLSGKKPELSGFAVNHSMARKTVGSLIEDSSHNPGSPGPSGQKCQLSIGGHLPRRNLFYQLIDGFGKFAHGRLYRSQNDFAGSGQAIFACFSRNENAVPFFQFHLFAIHGERKAAVQHQKGLKGFFICKKNCFPGDFQFLDCEIFAGS